MDPVSSATLFATIVGLLSDFSAERRNKAAASFDEFTQWLIETNHKEVVELLSQNHATAVSIKALLNQGHENLFARLQEIDKSIARMATGFNELRELAIAVYPNSEMSAQALSILEQFVDSGASGFDARRRHLGTIVLSYLDTKSGSIEYTDPRFILDDLDTLVDTGLITCTSNDRGEPVFRITRRAMDYVTTRRSGVTNR